MSKPLILHIAAVEYTFRRLVLPQLEMLADSGFDIRMACAPEGAAFDASLERFQPQVLRFPRTPSLPALLSAGATLRRMVSRLGPDLVHFHTPAAAIPGRAVLCLPFANRPLIAQTVHGFVSQTDRRTAMGRALAATERLLSRKTDLSLFVSGEDLQEASGSGHRGTLVYVGNGVGDEWFVPGTPRIGGSGRLKAVFVGRLVKEKGILDLLEAMAAVPGVELTVAGDQLPSDRDGVRAQAQRQAAGLGDRVRFTGMIDAQQVRSLLLDSDVLVLPSRREGLPISIIEAMACGLPIIATDIRGCRELVTPELNGWLVPPGSPYELAEILDHAAGLETQDLQGMGRASRARAEQYRLSLTVGKIVDAYRRLGL